MGGTIEFKDPGYEIMNEQMMKLDTTIDNYLKNMVKPHFTYSIESICNKDSRDIHIEDLEKLTRAIESSPHENILITHGTFTMKDTARFLVEYLTKMKIFKKVILTGSMIPIVGFSISDAAFNLGYSIASFKSVDIGVYICMNGGIFNYDEVNKNTELLRFE
jgi:L-asparaginase